MKNRKAPRLLLALAIFLVLTASLSLHSPASAVTPSETSPKLVVLIVVDQMRADYLQKFSTEWHGGLKRLTEQGAWFINAAYPYSNTVTCAGHSTISTGDFPATHGMIGNNWWDRDLDKEVNCTEDPSTHLIAYDGATLSVPHGDSAWRLKAPAFADDFRQAYPASRIIAFSIKARAAATLAGRHADSVTWLEGPHWVTSDAYGPHPSEVVAKFVTSHPLENDAGKNWTATIASTDSTPSAATHFSYAIGKPGGPVDAAFLSSWASSPYSDAYLGSMAAATEDGMHLGKNSVPDFLAISFSALDFVGHRYGPDSPEVHDVLINLDETLGKLLSALDNTVGAGKYVLAFSADHGVAPVPERAAAEGKSAGRIDTQQIVTQVQNALKVHGYADNSVALFDEGNIYLRPEARTKLKTDAAASKAVLAAVGGINGIAEVFVGDQLKQQTQKDSLARAASLSYFPGRSGDFIVLVKPYWLFDRRNNQGQFNTGTTHGSPYAYDQSVPVIFFGAGVKPGKYETRSSPANIVPTLAALSSIKIPPTDAPPLTSALAPPH